MALREDTQEAGHDGAAERREEDEPLAVEREARSRSEHIYDVEVTSSDKILTLSTCTRRFPALGKNQKFVVMAKLIDSAPVEAEVTANPSPKRPSL